MLELGLALALGLSIGILGTWLALREQWWQPFMNQKAVWQETFAKKKVETGELRRSLRVLAGQYEIAERKVELAETEVGRIRRELSQKQTEFSTTKAQLQEIEGYVHTVQGQLTEVQKQRDDLRKELRDAQDRPRRELAEARIALAELGGQYDALKQQTAVLEERRAVLEEDVQTLRQETAHWQGVLAATENQNGRLVEERDAANRGLIEMVHVGRELSELRQQMRALESAKPPAMMVPPPISGALSPPASANYDVGLRVIRGIGPTYARRLHEAGITNLQSLTQRTPEELAEIVQMQAWQKGTPTEWINQAQLILAQK